MKQLHPAFYPAAAFFVVLDATGIRKLVIANWQEAAFWQLAALLLLLVIAALSIALFIRVSRLYPGLLPFYVKSRQSPSSKPKQS